MNNIKNRENRREENLNRREENLNRSEVKMKHRHKTRERETFVPILGPKGRVEGPDFYVFYKIIL